MYRTELPQTNNVYQSLIKIWKKVCLTKETKAEGKAPLLRYYFGKKSHWLEPRPPPILLLYQSELKHNQWKLLTKNAYQIRVWRNGSVVKNICCSWRECGFSSQYQQDGSQLQVILVKRIWHCPMTSASTRHRIHIYTYRKNTQTYVKLFLIILNMKIIMEKWRIFWETKGAFWRLKLTLSK